jgi:hypothetical protein
MQIASVFDREQLLFLLYPNTPLLQYSNAPKLHNSIIPAFQVRIEAASRLATRRRRLCKSKELRFRNATLTAAKGTQIQPAAPTILLAAARKFTV